MAASDDGGGAFTYTLDAAGNRTSTSDGAYGFNGTGMLLHQYATGPGSSGGVTYGYDAAGRLASFSAGDGRSYVYDALGRLKEVRLVAGTSLSAMNELPAGAASESGTWALTDDGTGNKFLEDTGATPGRILWPPPAGMQVFSFTYWTGHDPADPDGDSDTSEDDPDHFDPKYYAQVMLRATQYEAPDPKEGEWRFLALVIQPDGLYLREFDGDHVEELGKAEVDIPNGQWHTVTIELGGEDGNHVVVKQLRNGAEKAERIEATTTIPGGGKVGFGVGSDANFRFDNVGTRQDVTLTATAALRYHYDANGRVVGRTLNPGGVDEESQYFIYDGDRIIQELDGSGNLVAAWDYGVYIDEILAMHRDTNNDGTLDTTYYLQDDLYNVIGLADASGNVVERYAYSDYGAPTIYSGDGATTRTESAYGNPFLFQGHRWDEVLSLYDYRTRYYDPAIGRFLRIDTIGLWGDANNLGNPYAFVGNNPWSRLDPYGEAAKDVDYNSVMAAQAVMENVLGMAAEKGWSPQQAGVYLHKQLQQELDKLGNIILLTECVIDEDGKILSYKQKNSLIPDVLFIILKEGENAQKFLNGSTSLRGHVNAVLDLKTGKAGIEEKWAQKLVGRLGITRADIIEGRRGAGLAKLFGVATETSGATKKLASKIMKKTGKTIARALPIAGVILAYKAGRDMGWSESEAIQYAMVSVFDGDIIVDAALFAEERFWVAAENYKGDLNDAYLDDLNDAITKSEQTSGHEDGIPSANEQQMGPNLERPGLSAGDIGDFVGGSGYNDFR